MNLDHDTICAIATPPGRGGVGIVRLSGPHAREIASELVDHDLKPRHAHYGHFKDDEVLDTGICIFFPGPNSFTGEDVVEFQGHGGPILLDRVIRALIKRNARVARPGEFSERAFLNGKLDLAQAEAVADLINASTEQAARGALQSLDGVFSNRINALVAQLTYLRVYVEAAIDFPDEEIDFLSDGKIQGMAEALRDEFNSVLATARQGALLRDGMTVVIAGRPNAGKSSLLNALTGKDSAIVTNIAGTTRDVLREVIDLDGLPVHVVDTAGLRDAPDVVEREGIKRAYDEIERADHILLVRDLTTPSEEPDWPSDIPQPQHIPLTTVLNKCDLAGIQPGIEYNNQQAEVTLSAATGGGVSLLRQHLKDSVGFQTAGEGAFMARRRHIDALERALRSVEDGLFQLFEAHAGELLAEDLRLAQKALGEITGQVTSDDLLGHIFGSFCIGK
ncbi:tRNA uridine-5-carboxymethylaminomethyl(34) synthesis GTPase MnmE [uncultured Umboniibacter sp.]|uniref:tRNA uridine-5-carboxymethylaminomethyl(34) synthesis GTPase MnmE n=1 Tax=uncultured Umboniibacter sp. TaxID=1798917 RepID=UPI0026362D84|nr:tRNA uridine-5-carboxymethylaminomethyl(34) synthesis GTPase MnmE [uncultured Umboniibacter sp.]